jgi:hypothetical protein
MMMLSRWRWLERDGERGRAEERSRGDAVVGTGSRRGGALHLLRGSPTRHAFPAASGIDNRELLLRPVVLCSRRLGTITGCVVL